MDARNSLIFKHYSKEAIKIYCFQTLCRIQPHHMEQLVSWLTAMNCLVSFLARFPSMSYEMRSKAVNVVPWCQRLMFTLLEQSKYWESGTNKEKRVKLNFHRKNIGMDFHQFYRERQSTLIRYSTRLRLHSECSTNFKKAN